VKHAELTASLPGFDPLLSDQYHPLLQMKLPEHTLDAKQQSESPARRLAPSDRIAGVQSLIRATFLIIGILHLARTVLSPADASNESLLVFWILAAVTVLAGLTRTLPAQNVASVAVIIGAVGAGLAFLPASNRFFIGFRFEDLDARSVLLFPLFWIACVVGCRGVARLAVQAWRLRKDSGFWTLGLATLLIAILTTFTASSFSPHLAPGPATYGIAPTNSTPLEVARFVGWILAAGVTLIFIAPWLINKRPQTKSTHFEPLAVWGLLNLDVLIRLLLQHSWPAAGFVLLLMLVGGATAGRYRPGP